jgi:hypothetical protein
MRFAALLMVPILAGCGAAPAPTTTVPLTEIDPAVIAAAQKSLPNVKFDSARKIQFGAEEVLEIRGKLPNGKVREVKVSASGRVVEVR